MKFLLEGGKKFTSSLSTDEPKHSNSFEQETDWYKDAVGGMWEEIGKLQFNFLVSEGLRPEHFLLDVGCGSLRGGIHFIKYLDTGHYFGTDINKELLKAGRFEIKINKLIKKKPSFLHDDNFEFGKLGQKFHFAVAISVFTHINLNDIINCILNVEKILQKNGKFYASFFENNSGKFNLRTLSHKRSDGPDIITNFNSDPFHYSFEIFKWICKDTSLEVRYLGDWSHPRGQRMMVFTKI